MSSNTARLRGAGQGARPLGQAVVGLVLLIGCADDSGSADDTAGPPAYDESCDRPNLMDQVATCGVLCTKLARCTAGFCNAGNLSVCDQTAISEVSLDCVDRCTAARSSILDSDQAACIARGSTSCEDVYFGGVCGDSLELACDSVGLEGW